MSESNVRIIPAKPNILTRGEVRKRRVAGYARVSTNNEEQDTSFKTQVEYYTDFIRKNPSWEFAGLYSDDGVSGTSIKKREGFKRMINDAKDGKIDLIITKSISRFARNTVDALQTIRDLKSHNVEIYFEKENIQTFDSKGELMLSILSSLAESESKSISDNVTWARRKRYADGFTTMKYKILGYKVNSKGKTIIVPEEARTVKLIYKLFMEGYGYRGIATVLNERKLKTPNDCGLWRDNIVKSILTNVKYKGDVLNQKYYTESFLTKKQIKNDGTLPQYYVSDNHTPIVSKELFDIVQEEVKKRKNKSISKDIIGNKVYCGFCDSHFGKRIWHSNDKYRTVVYRCVDKYKGDTCKNTYIKEDEIKDMFVKALNKVLDNKEEIIDNLKELKSILPDENKLMIDRKNMEDKLAKMADNINSIVRDIAKGIEHNDYDSKVKEYDNLKEKLTKLNEKISEIIERKSKLDLYIDNLNKTEVANKWTEDLWGIYLERMTVFKDKVDVKFNSGEIISIDRQNVL